MAYYIILKSLRSKEEFRKNPHIKFPSKSPCINFQSRDIFKNPIFILKKIPSNFGPATHRPIRPFGQRGPPGLSSSLIALAERCLLLFSRRRSMDGPLLLPHHGAPNGCPPITPLFNQPWLPPPSLPVMAAMKAPITTAARHYRPPMAPSDPIKRHPHSSGAPHPLHLASSPPHSSPRHSCLEPKPRRQCATSSPPSELR
jgi:hypothetical protein